jgi:DNA-binding XRE family transcriptional regulator
MNDVVGNVENSKPSGKLETNRTEPIYPWTAPNWRPRVDPNRSGPVLSSSSNPMTQPVLPWQKRRPETDSTTEGRASSPIIYSATPPVLYRWQTGYQPPLGSPEPEPRLQPMSRELLPFGQRIRELRLARGWTQRQVASALGVNVRTVIRHERGRTRRPWWSLLMAVRSLEVRYAEDYQRHFTRL